MSTTCACASCGKTLVRSIVIGAFAVLAQFQADGLLLFTDTQRGKGADQFQYQKSAAGRKEQRKADPFELVDELHGATGERDDLAIDLAAAKG